MVEYESIAQCIGQLTPNGIYVRNFVTNQRLQRFIKYSNIVGDIFSNEISSLTHLCTITSKVIKKIELETRLHTSFHDQAKFLKTTGLWLRAVK